MDLLVKNNKPYFKFTKDYLIRIKKALGNCSNSYILNKRISEAEEESALVEAGELVDILESLIFTTDLLVDDDYYESISGPYYDEFIESLKEYRDIRGKVTKANSLLEYGKWILSDKWVKNAVINGEKDILEQNINKMLRLIESISLIAKKRDLERAKETVLDSLSYIIDNEKILEYEKEYDRLLEQYPTDLKRIENYLRGLQKIILEDWKVGTTRIEDYTPGDKFRFVGHSTDAECIKGEFSSRLVSCSLFTEEFTDTYRLGVGFLFEPINIIGADDDDMYIDNYSDFDDTIMNSTSIPPISSIGKVLDVLRNNKEKQKSSGREGQIYSEVIIEGFNPIGIFCFTAGEKTLSINYQSALKLQEQFPHLPIIEIDLTLYKELDELEKAKERLIFEVEKSLNPRTQTRDKYYYDLYNLFWEKYLEMKKNKEYKEEDIVNLYQLNDYLISLRLDIKELFSTKYDIKEIRFSLLNNPIFGLNRIFYGAFNSFDLERLYNELIEFIHDPRLEEAVPGMRELLKLLTITNLTEEQVRVIRNQETITLENINEMLRYNIENKLEDIKSDIERLQDKKEWLSDSLDEKENQLQVQTRYRQIINQEPFYTLVSYDYRSAVGKLEIAQAEQARLNNEYEEESKQFNEKKESQRLLSQHRIRNFLHLRKLSVELSAFSTKLNRILMFKEVYDKSVNSIKQEIEFIYQCFKEQTDVEFLEYQKALADAHSNYSCVEEATLKYDIEEIQEQLRNIESQLAVLTAESSKLEEIQELKTK